jgi:hypothetical protein
MSKLFFLIPVFVDLMAFGAAAQGSFQTENPLSLSLRRHGYIKFRATDEGYTGC